jgi:hypothetical protein
MREIDYVKLAIGSEGMIKPIEEGCCEFIGSISCVPNDVLAFIAGG